MSMAVIEWCFSIDLGYRYQVLLDRDNLNWVRLRLERQADRNGVRMDSFRAVLVHHELSEQEMDELFESPITSRRYQSIARKLFWKNMQYSINPKEVSQ